MAIKAVGLISHRRAAMVGVLAALACAGAPRLAMAANYSYPATYTGTAANGGTVEFDVSADGSAVTRFVIDDVRTECGVLTVSLNWPVPIRNEAFVDSVNLNTTGGPNGSSAEVQGSFPAVQQAKGSILVVLYTFGSPSVCVSGVSWVATTPASPPRIPPRDTTAPQTRISSGPSGRTTSSTARFRFSASEAGATFECKLGGGKWASCRSPRSYKDLREGKHTFRVRAMDAAGNVDPSPAKRVWRVTQPG